MDERGQSLYISDMSNFSVTRIFCAVFLPLLLVSCTGGDTQDLTFDDVAIREDTVWKDRTVIVTGKLCVSADAVLTLDGVTLIFNPAVEDEQTFNLSNGHLVAIDSSIRSDSGKQWNLEADGASSLSFTRTTATNHSGIRAYDAVTLTARASEIEEVQCHDNATLDILDGSAVYLVLFFEDTGPVELPDGVLVAGDGITRDFIFKSTSAPVSSVQGRVNIRNADVWGFQLDLVGDTDLRVTGGTEIVLAFHLDEVGTVSVPGSITSDAPETGGVDFSANGGPSFTYQDTQISYVNVYVSGNSQVNFTGKIKVVEANVMDDATLTFESGAAILADLLQAYDSSTLTLKGSTLVEDYAFPSITAIDDAAVILNDVDATPNTHVYAVDGGRVEINRGAGWSESMFEETGGGSITYTP